MFLKISQNSYENTYGGVSFLIKLQIWGYNILILHILHNILISVLQKFVKRTEKLIFLLVFVCFHFTEISYFLNIPSNENVRKQHLSASLYSCVSILSNKAKYLHKIFCQIKQNYTKNELYSTVKHIWVVCKDLWHLNFIFIASLWHSLVFNSLFLLIVPSMSKAALKNF